MNYPYDGVAKIKREFLRKYTTPPYDRYVNGCGISSLRIMRKQFNYVFDIKDDKEMNALCLLVTLKEQAPPNLPVPSQYKGLKVFYETVGAIRTL